MKKIMGAAIGYAPSVGGSLAVVDNQLIINTIFYGSFTLSSENVYAIEPMYSLGHSIRIRHNQSSCPRTLQLICYEKPEAIINYIRNAGFTTAESQKKDEPVLPFKTIPLLIFILLGNLITLSDYNYDLGLFLQNLSPKEQTPFPYALVFYGVVAFLFIKNKTFSNLLAKKGARERMIPFSKFILGFSALLAMSRILYFLNS